MKAIDGVGGRVCSVEGLTDLDSTRHCGLPVTESPKFGSAHQYVCMSRESEGQFYSK